MIEDDAPTVQPLWSVVLLRAAAFVWCAFMFALAPQFGSFEQYILASLAAYFTICIIVGMGGDAAAALFRARDVIAITAFCRATTWVADLLIHSPRWARPTSVMPAGSIIFSAVKVALSLLVGAGLGGIWRRVLRLSKQAPAPLWSEVLLRICAVSWALFIFVGSMLIHGFSDPFGERLAMCAGVCVLVGLGSDLNSAARRAIEFAVLFTLIGLAAWVIYLFLPGAQTTQSNQAAMGYIWLGYYVIAFAVCIYFGAFAAGGVRWMAAALGSSVGRTDQKEKP